MLDNELSEEELIEKWFDNLPQYKQDKLVDEFYKDRFDEFIEFIKYDWSNQ